MKKALKKFLIGTFICLAIAFFPFWGVELGMFIEGLFTGDYCNKPTPCGNWGLFQWFYPFWLIAGLGLWQTIIVKFIVNVIKIYRNRES